MKNELILSSKEFSNSKMGIVGFSTRYSPPAEYLQFVSKYGSIVFKDSMQITARGEEFPVGDFYTLNEIIDLITSNEFELIGFTPFCEGGMGGYIGYYSLEHDLPGIYYLYQDRFAEDKGIQIASNFSEMIDKIEVEKTKVDNSRNIIKASFTPEFLELLKKRDL